MDSAILSNSRHVAPDIARLPPVLRPTSSIDVPLPSGDLARLPLCSPTFELWRGPQPSFTFGNKPVLAYGDAPIFAELLILRLLEREGWRGVWASSYPRLRFLSQMPIGPVFTSQSIPDEKQAIIDAITSRADRRGGCFDVFAWNDRGIIFCEAKRRSRDALRASQRRWIEAALATGIPQSCLLVVEWTLGDPASTEPAVSNPIGL